MIDAFLHAAMLMTTPILLAAIGGLINRIGGLVNLGLESMMLAGSLVAVELSAATGGAAVATVGAAAVGALVGLAMSPGRDAAQGQRDHRRPGLHRRRRRPGALPAEERLRRLWHLQSARRRHVAALRLPVVGEIPVLGAIVSGLDPLTWLAWILVPVTAFALHRPAGACVCARRAAPRRRCAPSASRR